MILVGSQRSGGQNLAAHLLRTDENEHVEVHELRGFASQDLHAAFKEVQGIARGTRCQQYLFSLSLNPPDNAYVEIEAFEKAIDRIEQELGLEGQPRAIVFHEKEGRRHAHVVWSRIDGHSMTAKPLSFFKTKLMGISRELYLEYDWHMPQGLLNKGQRNPLNFTLAEWQQAKRAGVDPRAIKQAIQDAWAVSDSQASFAHALQEEGFWLAQGDRRGFVAVDYTGEVYAISRAVNKTVKEVREKLGSEKSLPPVAQTKREIAAKMTPAIKAHIQEARRQFNKRKATLDHHKMRLVQGQQAERTDLKAHHQNRTEAETKARAHKLPKGLKAVWSKLTGKYKKQKRDNEWEALACAKRDGCEKEKLIASQLKERRLLQSEIKSTFKAQAIQLSDLRRDVHHYLIMGRIPDPPEQTRQRRQRRRRSPQLKMY